MSLIPTGHYVHKGDVGPERGVLPLDAAVVEQGLWDPTVRHWNTVQRGKAVRTGDNTYTHINTQHAFGPDMRN